MPVVDGWCTACRHHVLEHPRLRCPWCSERASPALMAELSISPELAAEEALQIVLDQLRAVRWRTGELISLRRELSMRLIATVPHAEIAGRTHHRLTTLERWAAAPDLAERKRRQAERRAARKLAAPKDGRPRKHPLRLREAWRAHERRLAAHARFREELAEVDGAAERLRDPLAPPGPREEGS